MRRLPALALLAVGVGASLGARAPAIVAQPTLAARDGSAWRVWWRATAAPTRWDVGDDQLARTARWQRAQVGLEWTEIELAGDGEAWRTRVVAARLDPALMHLTLDTAFASGLRPAWTLDRAPAAAAFAVNAGQFVAALPWGWVVLDGHEFLPPAAGPLASTVTIDSAGRIGFATGTSVSELRVPGLRPRWAFQSYPTLLVDGQVPAPLQAAGRGIDVRHRDARAALGRDANGLLVVALTRFDALGPSLGFVPFGLTVPEMAAVMGALGARDAVLLDGGISAQMLVRNAGGETIRWRGVRPVPLALVALPR